MGLETRLFPDADTAEFAVDVSVVVRDTTLGGERPADLTRLFALLAGLIEYSKNEDLRVYAVADWSLVKDKRLTERERARLYGWYRRGRIELHESADDRLLELAESTGQLVISSDGFADHVPAHPWIAGNRDRFLRPVLTPDGSGVTVVPRVMPVPLELEISRKIEASELLAMGMYDRRGRGGPRRELLARRWRCPEPDCPLFGPDEREFQPLPRFHDGSARCPTHRHPLEDVGGLPRRVQIKVRVDGVVRRRFLMRSGQRVAVGRAPGGDGVALVDQLRWLDPTVAHQLSRSHVVLRWTGWKLSVQDTSRNGTRIRPARGAAPDRVLLSGESARVRPGDEVVLVEGLELLASGREFAFTTVEDESAADDAQRPPGPMAEETVEIRSPLSAPWRPEGGLAD